MSLTEWESARRPVLVARCSRGHAVAYFTVPFDVRESVENALALGRWDETRGRKRCRCGAVPPRAEDCRPMLALALRGNHDSVVNVRST